MATHQVTRDQVCILIFDKLSSGDYEYQDTDPIEIMRRAQEPEEMATDKDTQAIDGDQDEGYCRVMWSPAADGRGPDGYILDEMKPLPPLIRLRVRFPMFLTQSKVATCKVALIRLHVLLHELN